MNERSVCDPGWMIPETTRREQLLIENRARFCRLSRGILCCYLDEFKNSKTSISKLSSVFCQPLFLRIELLLIGDEAR